ncbi:hypothetical protein RND81_07G204900 [Saponaria officinalis]|uniref:Uncharacterized protein n=1 Tax=Saponaria officinalis TaxID=3572 RepID=A0AAW1JT05_SAPOF
MNFISTLREQCIVWPITGAPNYPSPPAQNYHSHRHHLRHHYSIRHYVHFHHHSHHHLHSLLSTCATLFRHRLRTTPHPPASTHNNDFPTMDAQLPFPYRLSSTFDA